MTGIKALIIAAIGSIGGAILSAFGGWSDGMTALFVFMGCDIVTGLLVAIFLKSKKTSTGGLSSKTMTSGLCRKGGILILVLVAAQLDRLLGSQVVRDGVIIAFCANETISIIENVGLMGIKLPAIITQAIDILQKRSAVTVPTDDGGEDK